MLGLQVALDRFGAGFALMRGLGEPALRRVDTPCPRAAQVSRRPDYMFG
jgi:hypothetical protein